MTVSLQNPALLLQSFVRIYDQNLRLKSSQSVPVKRLPRNPFPQQLLSAHRQNSLFCASKTPTQTYYDGIFVTTNTNLKLFVVVDHFLAGHAQALSIINALYKTETCQITGLLWSGEIFAKSLSQKKEDIYELNETSGTYEEEYKKQKAFEKFGNKNHKPNFQILQNNSLNLLQALQNVPMQKDFTHHAFDPQNMHLNPYVNQITKLNSHGKFKRIQKLISSLFAIQQDAGKEYTIHKMKTNPKELQSFLNNLNLTICVLQYLATTRFQNDVLNFAKLFTQLKELIPLAEALDFESTKSLALIQSMDLAFLTDFFSIHRHYNFNNTFDILEISD